MLKKILKDENVDALFITDPKNVYYFTNFYCEPHERYMGLLVTEDKNILLVPAMEYENANKNLKLTNTEILLYLDTENAYMKLKETLGKYLKSISLEKEKLSYARVEKLIENFKVDKIVSIDDKIIELRKIKRKDEIEKIKKACELADKAIEIAKENMREGISELELKAIIEFEMKKLGVANMSFDTIVLFGKNAASPHGVSGETKLQKGDYALFDLGVCYENYVSDETRTIAFGNVSKEAKKIYDIVKKANAEAIKACKPGMKFSEIDMIARDIITKEGYGKYFTHRLGHGMGLDVHEYPDVSEKVDDILKENMVFTIEPGIYVPGVAGVRIEDDILITENSCVVLTKSVK